MVSITSFIRSGLLGPISIGVTKDYIENILGKPDDISISENPIILKYGSLQLAFYKEGESQEYTLNSIHIYFCETIKLPCSLHIQGWCPNYNTGVMEFIEYMHKNKIDVVPDELHTIENMQVGYRSKAGTIVIFDGEKLDSIHLAKK